MNTIRRIIGPGACCLVVALSLLGCGQGGSEAPPTTVSAEAQATEARKQFEEAQRRNEQENQRQLELEQRRRGFVQAEFHGIDAEGRVVVRVTNVTDKAIDDIRGGIHAEDTDGNYLASSGYTEAVPGSVFLDVGESKTHAPFISRRPELIERLQNQPESVRFAFEALAVTYADGSTEPGLDG